MMRLSMVLVLVCACGGGPQPLVDAGADGTALRIDASGIGDARAAADAGPCAAGGTWINGSTVCWRVGARGASCNATCVGYGGFDAVGSQHTTSLRVFTTIDPAYLSCDSDYTDSALEGVADCVILSQPTCCWRHANGLLPDGDLTLLGEQWACGCRR